LYSRNPRFDHRKRRLGRAKKVGVRDRSKPLITFYKRRERRLVTSVRDWGKKWKRRWNNFYYAGARGEATFPNEIVKVKKKKRELSLYIALTVRMTNGERSHENRRTSHKKGALRLASRMGWSGVRQKSKYLGKRGKGNLTEKTGVGKPKSYRKTGAIRKRSQRGGGGDKRRGEEIRLHWRGIDT